VFNAYKTLWQDVLRKSSDKFQLRQLHVPVSALLAVVFVTKPHLAFPNLLKPVVAGKHPSNPVLPSSL
jgi:hypothetical protein